MSGQSWSDGQVVGIEPTTFSSVHQVLYQLHYHDDAFELILAFFISAVTAADFVLHTTLGSQRCKERLQLV